MREKVTGGGERRGHSFLGWSVDDIMGGGLKEYVRLTLFGMVGWRKGGGRRGLKCRVSRTAGGLELGGGRERGV